jgi:integrase
MKGTKRRRATGHIRQRGTNSYELKFVDGNSKPQYVTFKGSPEDAKKKLRALLASVDDETYTPPSKATIADWVRARIDQWENQPGKDAISARTAARYRQLLDHQIVPHLGDEHVQRLKWLKVQEWHTALHKSGLAPRTIGHAHRVLGKALGDAVKAGIVAENPCKLQKAPTVEDNGDDMVIVKDVPAFVEKIAGSVLYPHAVLGLFTGMRLGEVLALKWSRVNLDRGVIEVREALEETKTYGIRFKAPKSKAGRRDITLPDIVVETLRDHRRAQLELRMQLGIGRMPDDGLLFPNIEGGPRRPTTVSADFAALAERIGMPEVTFHSLRHSHASQLIDANVDIVTISKRLGHSKPDITLRVYSHLFKTDDRKAAVAINAALAVS